MTSDAARNSFPAAERGGSAVQVEMNHVGSVDYDPSSSERQTIRTSALNGCIGVTALFRGESPDNASAMLSHFPPTGDTGRATANITQSVTAQWAQGRGPESVVIMAPGSWVKDETTGYWVKKPYATVEPDIEGYKQALGASGISDVKVVGYVPDDMALHGMSPDPNVGTMHAEFYKGSDDTPRLAIYVEGVAVPSAAK